jgi:hypothetical protein
VLFLIAIAVTSLAHWRSPVTVLCIVAVAVLLGAYTLTTGSNGREIEDPTVDKGAIQTLIDHELAGLTDPGSSTGPLHIELVTKGLTEGIEQPLGSGVSHGSIAQHKNAPGLAISSESDIGNVAAGLGAFAGLVLLGIIIAAFAIAIRLQLLRPSVRHLAALGIAVAAFGQWATGALYCTSTILWLLLGGLSSEWSGLSALRPGRTTPPVSPSPATSATH